VCVTT